MKIKLPFYKIEIDTKNKKYKSIKRRLKNLYAELPATKCLFCPNKCGVEADCCKVFSPPMLLVEFVSALEEIEKWDDQKKRDLLFQCLDSLIKTETTKPCVLLNNTLCSIYESRPLGCKLFAMYPDEEWEKRLNNISAEMGEEKENLPFYKQCKNIEVEGEEKVVPTERSDRIFQELYKLDVSLFPNKEQGELMVISNSATYMPFETHYLCYRLGSQLVQTLTDMKLASRELKKRKKYGNLEFIKGEKNLKEFISTLKNTMITNNLV